MRLKRKFRRRLILAFMLLIAAGAGFLYTLLWVPNRFSEDKVIIEDVGSRNGTLLNGEKLSGKQSLEPNILVSLGYDYRVVTKRAA